MLVEHAPPDVVMFSVVVHRAIVYAHIDLMTITNYLLIETSFAFIVEVSDSKNNHLVGFYFSNL